MHSTAQSLEPSFPIQVKPLRIEDLRLPFSGGTPENRDLEKASPIKYDLVVDVAPWLHPFQRRGGRVKAHVVYEFLKEEGLLGGFLGGQDGFAISQTQGIASLDMFDWGFEFPLLRTVVVFPEHYNSRYVSILYKGKDGKLKLRWVNIMGIFLDLTNPILRFSDKLIGDSNFKKVHDLIDDLNPFKV